MTIIQENYLKKFIECPKIRQRRKFLHRIYKESKRFKEINQNQNQEFHTVSKPCALPKNGSDREFLGIQQSNRTMG